MVPAGGLGRSRKRSGLQRMPQAAQPGNRGGREDGERRITQACNCRQRSEEMNITRRHFLVLLPAAALAWEHVLAGTPEQASNYNTSEHWWGMLVDIEKCIGCGSCVRACQKENNVPDGFYRTWI